MMTNNQEFKCIGNKTESDKQSGIKLSNLGELTRTGGPGRPVGSKNKVPANLRDDLVTVYEKLGGIQGMVEWAKAKEGNRALFYRILASTIPRQVAVSARLEYGYGLNKLSNDELMEIIEGTKRFNDEGESD
jgi:hypothetical protein